MGEGLKNLNNDLVTDLKTQKPFVFKAMLTSENLKSFLNSSNKIILEFQNSALQKVSVIESIDQKCKKKSFFLGQGRLKKNCIFYDIWQKGRGSKDQIQISEKNLNLDKVLGGVGKRLQCHKNSYLNNQVFYCLETALFCPKISIFSCLCMTFQYCHIGQVRNLV